MSIRMLSAGFGFFLTVGAATASQVTDDGLVALADQQAKTAQLAMQLAPIRTEHHLHQYISAYPRDISAFAGMAPADLNQFLASLTFNNKGLTGFDPTPLKKLSPSQVYKILSLFGMQSGTSSIAASPKSEIDMDLNVAPFGIGEQWDSEGPFLEGYRCEGQHTCRESQRAACTSNC